MFIIKLNSKKMKIEKWNMDKLKMDNTKFVGMVLFFGFVFLLPLNKVIPFIFTVLLGFLFTSDKK